MKIEESQDVYKVTHISYGIFAGSIIGLIIGIVSFFQSNWIGVAICLFSIGLLFLPFRRIIEVNSQTKNITLTYKGIYGQRIIQHPFSSIQKFVISSDGTSNASQNKQLHFIMIILNSKFIDRIALLPVNSIRSSSFSFGLNQISPTKLKHYTIYKKIADLCGKTLEYQNSHDLLKEALCELPNRIEQARELNEKGTISKL